MLKKINSCLKCYDQKSNEPAPMMFHRIYSNICCKAEQSFTLP